MKAKRCLFLLVALFLFLTGCKDARVTEHTTGAENYNVISIVQKHHHDLDSNLSVFPYDIQSISASYEATVTTGGLDIEATIILDCRYEEYMYDAEVRRLKGLSMTLKSGGHKTINYVKLDEKSYHYPAYVTIDGFGNNYEYALLDEENLRIIYVYLAYPNVKKMTQTEFLKKDLSLYDKQDGLKGFSLYSHSFHRGEWVEFDDVQ